MVHGNNDESHMRGCDSGNEEGGTHLRDGSEAELIESINLFNNFLFSACYVSASMNHEENMSTVKMLMGE